MRLFGILWDDSWWFPTPSFTVTSQWDRLYIKWTSDMVIHAMPGKSKQNGQMNNGIDDNPQIIYYVEYMHIIWAHTHIYMSNYVYIDTMGWSNPSVGSWLCDIYTYTCHVLPWKAFEIGMFALDNRPTRALKTWQGTYGTLKNGFKF